MKRREVLKGLTIAAGSALWPGPASLLRAQQNSPATQPLAVPIRGLTNKAGRLQQPIQIAIHNFESSATAVIKLNGTEVDRRQLAAGPNTFQVFAEPVNAPQDVKVTVAIGDSTTSGVVQLQPVRKVLVYILPHSHHDLGYTDIQSHIEEKQMQNITLAIDLAHQTADYPKGARFVWNSEVLWGVDLFMRRRSQSEKDGLIDAIKSGLLSLNGMYANELTGLCRPEELSQLFRYGLELSKQCGVTIDSAMLSDVPGYTWGTITAMSQAGIRYFSAAPNNGDRIGTLKLECHDRPFWHISPSGKEKVLVWMPGHGYASWGSGSPEMAAGCQEFLDSVNFQYEISYVRWSGHGDNALPDPQICEFVKSWNQEYEWPKFAIASTSEAFSAFEKRYGSEIPQFKGDLTPYWEDGAGSSALETAINRNSADRLAQAATIAAMSSPGTYQTGKFTDAWRNILLYSEHTWGAGGSVRYPDAPMTTQQWAVKRQFALDGEKQSKELINEAVRAYGAAANATAIDVLNANSWARTEVIMLSKELSSVGDQVKDDHGSPIPSQRLSTGELAILAREVPAFGSGRFHLSTGKAHEPARPAKVVNGVLENGIIRAQIDAETGNLVELSLNGKSANLIDTSSGESGNEYLFVEGQKFEEVWKTLNEAQAIHYRNPSLDGSDIGSITKSGPVHITIEEEGPLVVSLRIESSAPGCNSLVRRVRLAAEADWLELSNIVDKKPAPSPPPGLSNDGARAWSNYGGKESVHFAFPFSVPKGAVHMDIPLAEMQPEIDQLPGSCKNWLPVGRWIDVANENEGVTWVTLDAPLVEVGELSATLVGGQGNALLWREHIAETQKIYSWAMNNHWETNYCASQQGVVEFRYVLRAHGVYNPAAASRLAIGLSQPLIPCFARQAAPVPPLLRIEPADLLALSFKPSDDGNAWIVRLFGASGADRIATLHWSTPAPRQLWLSDLSEKPIKPLDQSVKVGGWELLTLRADR
jgi:hypothetical protein